MHSNARFEFLGTRFSITNPESARELLLNYNFAKAGYVSFPDSSVVASALRNPALQQILNESTLTFPDGKPSEFYARMKGYKGVSTVSGYWLSKSLFGTDLTHYFIGGTAEKLDRIIKVVKDEFPNARILGYSAPPYLDVSYFENGNLLEHQLEEINRLQPDLIWVGLSSPKQDFLMKYHVPKLKRGLMLGVGGVFDYLSGDVKKSPEWVKRIGMRWLWRLMMEPRRLGRKYGLTVRTLLAFFARETYARTRAYILRPLRPKNIERSIEGKDPSHEHKRRKKQHEQNFNAKSAGIYPKNEHIR